MNSIETTRLLLRGLRESDRAPLLRVLGDAAVMRLVFAGGAMPHGEAEAFLGTAFTFGRENVGLGVLCERDSGDVVGFAGVIPCTSFGSDDLEFGFALRMESWGRGYATEIGHAQIAFGFRELALDRMLALVHPGNQASVRVLEKLGMNCLTEVCAGQRGPRRVYVAERSAVSDAGRE